MINKLTEMLINKRFQHSPTETISRWIRRRTAVGKRLVTTFLEVAVDISCRSKHLRIQALRIRRRHWAVDCVPFSLISENKTFQPTLVETRIVWILRIRCLMFRRVHGLVIELLPAGNLSFNSPRKKNTLILIFVQITIVTIVF